MQKFKYLLLLLSFLSLLGCRDTAEQDLLLIQTGEVSRIGREGASFHARLINFEDKEIDEYGFVWGLGTRPEYASDQKVIFENNPGQTHISHFVSTNLKEGRMYSVRAFVKSKSLISYGNTVHFTSLGSGAPQIIRFYPAEANLRDTISIIGSNFSYLPESMEVFFGEEPARIIQASQDSIRVIVPEKLRKGAVPLSVVIENNPAHSAEKFRLVAPQILDFYPKLGNRGDTLTIIGKNLAAGRMEDFIEYFEGELHIGNTHYGFGFYEYGRSILYISPDSLRLIIKNNLEGALSEIILTNYNYQQAKAEKKFELSAPLITDFYPRETIFTDTLSIVGKNFTSNTPSGGSPDVYIGGQWAHVLKYSEGMVQVKVPYQISGEYAELTIRNHNRLSYSTSDKLRLKKPEISDFSPKEGNMETKLSIRGINFPIDAQFWTVEIGSHTASLLDAGDGYIEVEIPRFLDSRHNLITLKLGAFSWQSIENFSFAPLAIHDFNPKTVEVGDKIWIDGENFHSVGYLNKVYFGDVEARVISASPSSLQVLVPSQLAPPRGGTRETSLTIEVLGESKIFSEKVVIKTY